MNGKGSFPKKQSSTAPTPATIEKIQNIDQTVESFPEKEIERIVIFYKDGSFENYNP
jgi:hypothetical protein